jgi:hypothetical protein
MLSQNSRVSVITCGTGNESTRFFGHTAIRISDPDNYIDAVFNYGAFDFNTLISFKFAKGDLEILCCGSTIIATLSMNTPTRNDLCEQEHLFLLVTKQQLFDNLTTTLASGDSHYTFIDKNCTSMVVDMLTNCSTVITKRQIQILRTVLFYTLILIIIFYEN